jgi:hypothetical protein
MSNDLYVVTVVTKTDYYFPYLLESCKRYNIKLDILGNGQKWQGFTWRLKLMIDYLKNKNSTHYVCFIDGYDVICNKNLKDLKIKFLELKRKHNCKIVFSGDEIYNKELYKLNEIFINYYFGKCKNTNLNAGLYIGGVTDVLEMLTKIYNKIKKNNNLDDQQLIIKYCNKYNNDIYIDIHYELFLTFNKPYSEINKYLTIKDNTIYYKNKNPFFIHAPGNTYLENTLKLLCYTVLNNNIQKEMIKRWFMKMCFLFKNKIKYFILFILIIIFILNECKLIKF